MSHAQRMSDITVKRGDSAGVTFSVFAADGVTPENLTGKSVFLVIGGTGSRGRAKIAVTVDTPASLGTGSCVFTAAHYAALRDAAYQFEVWMTDGTTDRAVRTGTMQILDVPQL